MSWLTNFVKPKLRELVGRRDIPDNLWLKCPSCEQMIFHRELAKNLRVCPHCAHHLRLAAGERLAMLFDDAAYQTLDAVKAAVDPLKFRDLRKYAERLKEAQQKTGQPEALLVGVGRVGGHPAVIAAMNFDFMGGSMGVAVGEGLLAAARRAIAERAAFVVVCASGGARMQEGILSLMQMARTTIAVEEVKEAGLPYLVILTDPTTGGVSASFAMLGDITLAEPGAVIGFAGARVIEQTIRETLPAGFQKAEYLYDHGMIDQVVPRRELAVTLARILGLLLPPPLPAEPTPATVVREDEAAPEPTAADLGVEEVRAE